MLYTGALARDESCAVAMAASIVLAGHAKLGGDLRPSHPEATLDYAAAKWPYAAANHRKSIAEALTDATEAMLATDEPLYPVEQIRRPPNVGVQRPAPWRSRTARRPGGRRALAANRHPAHGRLQPPGNRRYLLPRDPGPDQPQAGQHSRGGQHRKPQAGRPEQPHAVRDRDRCGTGQSPQGRQVDPPAHAKTVDPRTVVNSDQARRLLAAVA